MDQKKEKIMLKHELIGLQMEVLNSSNPTQIGIKGMVIDETRNTLVILNDDGKKIIEKKTVIFKIFARDESDLEVEGIKMVGRPFERIKK